MLALCQVPAFKISVCLPKPCHYHSSKVSDFSCSYPVGAFYFSFAKLVQAAFCKYWSLAPDSCSKYRQPSAFSSSRQGVAKENVVFQDFAGNSLHLHAFSLPTTIST